MTGEIKDREAIVPIRTYSPQDGGVRIFPASVGGEEVIEAYLPGGELAAREVVATEGLKRSWQGGYGLATLLPETALCMSAPQQRRLVVRLGDLGEANVEESEREGRLLPGPPTSEAAFAATDFSGCVRDADGRVVMAFESQARPHDASFALYTEEEVPDRHRRLIHTYFYDQPPSVLESDLVLCHRLCEAVVELSDLWFDSGGEVADLWRDFDNAFGADGELPVKPFFPVGTPGSFPPAYDVYALPREAFPLEEVRCQRPAEFTL